MLRISATQPSRRIGTSLTNGRPEQKQAAYTAPAVHVEELTPQQWFERGFAAVDMDEQLLFYNEAIGSSRTLPIPFITEATRDTPKAT
jgi:hypothetical protein